jgi:hypothetical protein
MATDGPLFDAVVFAPPGWIVDTRVDPVGLLVIAGPTAATVWPTGVDDDAVDRMLTAGRSDRRTHPRRSAHPITVIKDFWQTQGLWVPLTRFAHIVVK